MFYRPEDGHGLPHNPFNAIVAPRPIAWVGTRGRLGDNLAPYSFFNAVAYVPPQVMFASTSAKDDRDGTKDSVAQIEETGVFSISTVAFGQRDVMNLTSGPHPAGTDEFALAGVAKAECETIDAPRVADAPATLECRLTRVERLPGAANRVVFGEVVGVHLRDDCVVDGRFDLTAFDALARCGYRDYAVVRDVFELKRPDD
ncbi:flavin reductase family protein [Jannaschia sp. Os4]|uniref:flavin reductase family protein n=1 Tax=Jannaschia sp. Os4 TaxID=2807617 RepID=UPI00193A8632|nr:flavin reductase family protein [Jannaschia sp. Os4]MBM2574874.1 flavin reductase family protein [Jannaschia sp. Os4]